MKKYITLNRTRTIVIMVCAAIGMWLFFRRRKRVKRFWKRKKVKMSKTKKLRSWEKEVLGLELKHGERLDGLAQGDASLILGVMPEEEAGSLFQEVKKEISWSEMYHRGNFPVPRLVAIQGTLSQSVCGTGNVEPVYRHPVQIQPALTPWTPTVDRIRKTVEQMIGQELNHCLIQRYRGGEDYISEHTDKTLDIMRGSKIVNVSLGATRVMRFRRKRDRELSEREYTRLAMSNNSVVILGWETNRSWTHGIHKDKRMEFLKRPDELIENGERISLTFRQVGTYRRLSDGVLFGQGAVWKTEEDVVITCADEVNQEEEEERLLAAFGVENSTSEFDWDKTYGEGFNLFNLKII